MKQVQTTVNMDLNFDIEHLIILIKIRKWDRFPHTMRQMTC